MAEIETKKTDGKKKIFNKKSTRVDLTPMVDLGFLLITFFVFTTTLSTPMAMNLVMPDDRIITMNDPVCESCVLTILLDKDNRIKFYEGAVENNPAIQETGFAANEIRTMLMNKKEAVSKARGNKDQFILIIKGGHNSNFENFVDITDEVTICQIKKYYLDELSDADKKILAKK